MDEETEGRETKQIPLYERLVELRQKANMTSSDIASKLHVCKSVIDNIESNQIESIPSVFLRGYIRSYAKVVKLPESELNLYLETYLSVKEPVKMRNFSHKEQRKKHGKRLMTITIILIILILCISVFFIWTDSSSNQNEITRYTPMQYIEINSDNS